MVYSLHLFRALQRQFKLHNGEQAKSEISERRKLGQSIFEQIALLVFKALRGITPMYLQDLLQVKTPGRYSLRSDSLGLLTVPHTWCKTFGHPKKESMFFNFRLMLILSENYTLYCTTDTALLIDSILSSQGTGH